MFAPALHSFPTRRSSDLDTATELERVLRASEFGPLLRAADCQWPTSANGTFRIDRAADYLEVDRLHLDFYAASADLRLGRDRKSTRLNSSHTVISYADFC